METCDIIELARNQLCGFRDEIANAANADWQKTCLENLQDVTGLKINQKYPGYEARFLAVAEYRSDFSFPSRPIIIEAERLSAVADRRKGYSVDLAATELVKCYFKKLPPEKKDIGLIDILGMYYREEQTKTIKAPYFTATAIGASIELYWARIAKLSELKPPHAKLRTVGKGPVAKVVMLHELAHYVTHQGCSDDNGKNYWEKFPFDPAAVAEVVAQAATDEVICRHHQNDPALREAFDALIEGLEEENEYRAHQDICKKLKQLYDEGKSNYSDFWHFFRDKIRQGKLITVHEIYEDICVHCVYKKGEDDCGWNLETL